jgi:hypothetical protein
MVYCLICIQYTYMSIISADLTFSWWNSMHSIWETVEVAFKMCRHSFCAFYQHCKNHLRAFGNSISYISEQHRCATIWVLFLFTSCTLMGTTFNVPVVICKEYVIRIPILWGLFFYRWWLTMYMKDSAYLYKYSVHYSVITTAAVLFS